MVSHTKRSKAGGRQNPNAARKTPQKSELQRQSKPPRLVCVSCRSIGARCNGDRPCSHCEGWLKSDCVYEDSVTCYPTIYKVKKKDVPQQDNQPKSNGNNDTNKATVRVLASETAHKVGDLDEQGFRKHLDQLNEAYFLRSKVSSHGESSSSSSSQNAPPIPTAVDDTVSTNTSIQPSRESVSAAMGPPLLMAEDTLELAVSSDTNAQPSALIPLSNDIPLSVDAAPLSVSLSLPLPPPPLPPPPLNKSNILHPISNGSQLESSLKKGKQIHSHPSSIEKGDEHIPNVPDYACHLIDKNTGYLKHDHKVAVITMLRRFRSALNGPKTLDKEAHKPIMPPYELSLYLLRIYHKEVCYLFPFICFSAFMRAYRSLNGDADTATGFSPSASFGLGGSEEATNTHPLMFRCALFTMLSHASKFAKMKEKDQTFLSRAFWECACAHLTPALVKENSLAAVQTFLIVAVSLNSTRLPGDKRKIPIEIAYRLAQYMRLDDDGDGIMRSLEEKEVRMKAWYGCVMMTSFIQSGVNFHFSSASGVDIEALISADQPPSGSIPFSFFTSCVARCEELEKILQNMPKTRSHILSREPSNRYPRNLAELPTMFAKFQSVLPASLDWTTVGIPVLEHDIVKSNDMRNVDSGMLESQTEVLQATDIRTVMNPQRTDSETETSKAAVCNTSFMLIRSMLYGPIFMEAGIQECLASGEDISALNAAGEQKARFCALQCLKNAIHLINYMHRRSTPGERVREPWWDPYHVGTAGLIIIMAQTSESLWTSFDQTLLQKTWKFCQELLMFDRFNSTFKRDVIEFLWKVNNGITKGRILVNEYFMMPEPLSATEKGKGGFKSWTFDIDPSHLEPDGINRIPALISSRLPYEDYTDIEISPRTKIEDVPAIPQTSIDFSGRLSLTPSGDTDLAFTPSTDLDFTFTPSMMDMDFTMDPNSDGNPTQLVPSSNTPFSPSIWDISRAYQRAASIPVSSSYMPFTQQPPWTAAMVACFDPVPASASNMDLNQLPLTASMAYSQPVPGPGVSGSDVPPLRVMHFDPSLSTDHGQSAFSKDTPTLPPIDYAPSTTNAAFNGGNIFLNGLRRKGGT